jgi:hypothetical protein
MKYFIVFLFAILLSGCVTIMGYEAKNVSLGMSPEQVESIVGRPDRIEQDGRFNVYRYLNRFYSGWSWDVTDYSFIFEDGKLVAWGEGEIRKGAQPVPFIYYPSIY